jgi:hypothetical protein
MWDAVIASWHSGGSAEQMLQAGKDAVKGFQFSKD